MRYYMLTKWAGNATEILQNEALLRLLKLALVAEAACLQQTERQRKTSFFADPYGQLQGSEHIQLRRRHESRRWFAVSSDCKSLQRGHRADNLLSRPVLIWGCPRATLESMNSNKHWAQRQYTNTWGTWKRCTFKSKLSAVLQVHMDLYGPLEVMQWRVLYGLWGMARQSDWHGWPHPIVGHQLFIFLRGRKGDVLASTGRSWGLHWRCAWVCLNDM